MAKRRNAKKEKAIRNKLNARKFRKASSRRTGKYRRYQSNNEEYKSNDEDSSSKETQTNQGEKTQAKTHTENTQVRSVPKPNIASSAKTNTTEDSVKASAY